MQVPVPSAESMESPEEREGTEPLPSRASPPQNARPDTPLEIPLLKTQSVYDRMTLFNRMD